MVSIVTVPCHCLFLTLHNLIQGPELQCLRKVKENLS